MGGGGAEPFLNTGRERILKALLMDMMKRCGGLSEVVCLGGTFFTIFAPCFDVSLEYCGAEEMCDGCVYFVIMRWFYVETLVTVVCDSTANKMSPAYFSL